MGGEEEEEEAYKLSWDRANEANSVSFLNHKFSSTFGS